MLPVDLRHLEFIVAAASHRSLRHAAETLGVKQSTLSRSIRTVESVLGVKLFERSNTGTRTTAAGAAFVEGAEIVVDTTARIVAGAKAAGRGNGGRLQLGAHTSLTAGHFRATLAEFRGRASEVDIGLLEGSTERLLIGVRAGVIDMAIITGEAATPGIRCVPVWTDKVVVALPRAHPLAERDALYWTDLAAQTVLVSSRDPGPQLEARLLAKLAAPDLAPRVQRHDVAHATLPQLVSAGLGLALVCETSAEFGSHVQVREIRDGSGPIVVEHSAYFRSESRNPALLTFLRLLQERYPSRSWLN